MSLVLGGCLWLILAPVIVDIIVQLNFITSTVRSRRAHAGTKSSGRKRTNPREDGERNEERESGRREREEEGAREKKTKKKEREREGRREGRGMERRRRAGAKWIGRKQSFPRGDG